MSFSDLLDQCLQAVFLTVPVIWKQEARGLTTESHDNADTTRTELLKEADLFKAHRPGLMKKLGHLKLDLKDFFISKLYAATQQ